MASSDVADLVITGAPVLTMDGVRRWADAVAVRGGRISAVGAADDVRNLVSKSTRVIELDGGMVLPGFQDAHLHPLHAGLAEAQCDLHYVVGADGYTNAISTYAREHPEREWVLGSGWSMDAFPGGTPHRLELDRLVSDRPAFLVNRDGHGAWVNTRALEMASITRSTSDPRDGRIERDENGEPSGSLHEGAMDLVRRLVPPPTIDDLVDALRRAQRRLLAFGITAWQDAWIVGAELEAYRRLADSGELTARIVLSLLWERQRDEEQLPELLERRERGTIGRMRAATAKIFQDGVVENFTAAMTEPYLDASGRPTDNSGISMIEPEALKRYVTLLDREGFQVHIHAIGDRAVRESLDAIEAARTANGVRDARHHICHLQVVHPEDVPRFRGLNVVPNCQPFWACNEPQMRELTIPFLGPERAAHQYPFASLRRAGATLAFGSDWPVSTPDPLLEIEVAVTRVPPDERSEPPFLPDERLDLPAALEGFTMGSAYVNRLDESTGSIESGKLADICVLDRDLFALDGANISDARVVLTLVEGEAVYDPQGIL
ncbi:MAG: amidohydrolase [Actinomycetota bacterium]